MPPILPHRPHRGILLRAESGRHSLPRIRPVLHVRGPGSPAAHGGERLGFLDAGAGQRPSSLLDRRAEGQGGRVAPDAEVRRCRCRCRGRGRGCFARSCCLVDPKPM